MYTHMIEFYGKRIKKKKKKKRITYIKKKKKGTKKVYHINCTMFAILLFSCVIHFRKWNFSDFKRQDTLCTNVMLFILTN